MFEAWSTRSLFTRFAAEAAAEGDARRAETLRAIAEAEREVDALDALGAQHELARELCSVEWLTVRAAREAGASWSQIAQATGTGAVRAREAFLDIVEAQHHYGFLSDTDAEGFRAAAGRWTDELRPDTPPQVLAEIEQASAAGDQDRLAALRVVWWDTDHHPHHTGRDTGGDTDREDDDGDGGAEVGGAAGPQPEPDSGGDAATADPGVDETGDGPDDAAARAVAEEVAGDPGSGMDPLDHAHASVTAAGWAEVAARAEVSVGGTERAVGIEADAEEGTEHDVDHDQAYAGDVVESAGAEWSR
ncbi:hypothetical protein [Pseudonocardia humida]|uniref:DUF222 domain-containing protein n=1 Tax=Pseudonocardia humida TaxID=2800819 RepID=A0ABT1A557_9PSEU|nr:hypothetical protein [Pseudonocardia humida]MCO1658115.1 hypothetical protein [Pseudonocardia humida]